MSDVSKLDWQDAKTYRDPKWPVGWYAPGDYMGKCGKCGGQFMNMDKRAGRCFPCAIEDIVEANASLKQEVAALVSERDTLKAAIQIVSASQPTSSNGE